MRALFVVTCALSLGACTSDEPGAMPEDMRSPGQDMATLLDMRAEDMRAEDMLAEDMRAEDMRAEDMRQPVACTPLAAGAMTREGQQADGWSWQKQGRVFELDEPDVANGEGDFAPSLIFEAGGGYRLYFARRRAGAFSLYTTTSPDGITWSQAQPLEGLQGDTYPAALRMPDGLVRIWFGSGSLDYAESLDGVSFTGRQQGLLRPSQVGGFASISMIYPEVRQDTQGAYRLFITGFDGETFRIGAGTSPDGLDWSMRQGFVMERDGEGFDSTSVGQPELHRINDIDHLWYGGYDTTNTNPGPWRIGLATSTDGGLTFERKGVSIALAGDGDDAWSTRDPALLRTAEGWLMVYVGLAPDMRYRLLVATSTTCAP